MLDGEYNPTFCVKSEKNFAKACGFFFGLWATGISEPRNKGPPGGFRENDLLCSFFLHPPGDGAPAQNAGCFIAKSK